MKPRKTGKGLRAFTLVEMAVVLVMVGLMTGLVVQSQRATQPTNCYAITKAHITSVRTALDNFITKNNRLPLPAGRSLAASDPQFGREAVSAGDGRITASNGVLFGALPFQALGLPSSYAADCWGNKYTYAATTSLTAANSVVGADTTDGVITVRSSATQNVMTNAAYVVVSHGENGAVAGNGGVSANYRGTGQGWCSTGANAPLDRENCNTTNAIFVVATFNNGTSAGANYFDDVVIYSGKPNAHCTLGSYSLVWGTGAADGQCSASVSGAFTSGTPVPVTYDSTHFHGTATATCRSGTMVLSDQVCEPYFCAATTMNWSGQASCSGEFAQLSSGSTSQPTANSNTADGTNGFATASCTHTTWSSASGNCCIADWSWNGSACARNCPENGGTQPNCTCISNKVYNATDNTCGCAPGRTWDGTTCALNCPESAGTQPSCSCISNKVYDVATNTCGCEIGKVWVGGRCETPVPGGWTNWADVSACSKECGGGEKTQTRSCTSPAPAFTGADCTGSNIQLVQCNAQPCPVNGRWTIWSEPSSCSVTCGGGKQTRTRSCTNPPPAHGGKDCEGPSIEETECNTHACPCSGSVLTWGDSCLAYFSETPSGQSKTVTNAADGYQGTAGATCTNGVWSAASGSCTLIPGVCGPLNDQVIAKNACPECNNSGACNSGAFGLVDKTDTAQSWTCGTGTAKVSCRADFQQIRGVCGSANGAVFEPGTEIWNMSGRCDSGEPHWIDCDVNNVDCLWECRGDSGSVASCRASHRSARCGSANGAVFEPGTEIWNMSDRCASGEPYWIDCDKNNVDCYWECRGSGTVASCHASHRQIEGACGPLNGTQVPAGQYPCPECNNSGACNSGTVGSVSQSDSGYFWTCDGTSGQSVQCFAPIQEVQGVCGAINGELRERASDPAFEQGACAAGSAEYRGRNDWVYEWYCVGSPRQSGRDVVCHVDLHEHGHCGNLHRQSYPAEMDPFTETRQSLMCNPGRRANIRDTGNGWEWDCIGEPNVSRGETEANVTSHCSGSKYPTGVKVDGVCGSSNGGAPKSAAWAMNLGSDLIGLCASGFVGHAGCDWRGCGWRCEGFYGGGNESCYTDHEPWPN